MAKSQTPFAALLTCADSRVPSEIIFDQGLGDLFVCRVAGNIATDEEIGSLEFGTMILGAKLIMVLGHKNCGAVKAAMEGGKFPGNIGSVINNIRVSAPPVSGDSSAEQLEKAIKANIVYQSERLNQSIILGNLIDKNWLKIVGAYYNLETGKVELII